MATIGEDPNGHKWILFVAADSRREIVLLSKVSLRIESTIKAEWQV
jgi:hypothetical protein